MKGMYDPCMTRSSKRDTHVKRGGRLLNGVRRVIMLS